MQRFKVINLNGNTDCCCKMKHLVSLVKTACLNLLLSKLVGIPSNRNTNKKLSSTNSLNFKKKSVCKRKKNTFNAVYQTRTV